MKDLSFLEFENWVLNSPSGSSEIIGIRASLRVIPVLKYLFLEKNFHENKEEIFIGTLRACFISDLYVNRQRAEFYDIAFAVYEKFVESPTEAGTAVRAAHATISKNKTFTSKVLHATNTSSSEEQLLKDLEWVENNPNNVRPLLSKKLWFSEHNFLSREWQDLKRNLLVLDPNWQFWIDWYQAKLNGTVHSGLVQDEQESLYSEIAGFPDELWEEGATAVNEQIVKSLHDIKKPAEVSFLQARFVDGKYLGVSANNKSINLEVKPKPVNSKTEQFRTLINSPEFRSNVEKNKVAIAFISSNLLLQIEEYKEKIRIDNQLSIEQPDLKEGLLKTLNDIEKTVENLDKNIKETIDEKTKERFEDIAEWFNKFQKLALVDFQKYISPENISQAAVPVTIIMSCGGLGALLGGPVGFGAGSVFGQFLTKNIKPKDIVEKVEENFESKSD